MARTSKGTRSPTTKGPARRRRSSRTPVRKQAGTQSRSRRPSQIHHQKTQTSMPHTITWAGALPFLPGLWKLFEGTQDLGSLSIGLTFIFLSVLMFICGLGIQAFTGAMNEISEGFSTTQEGIHQIANALQPIFTVLLMPQTTHSMGRHP